MIYPESLETSVGRLWLGAHWESFTRRPSRQTLIRLAKDNKATHFCLWPPEGSSERWLVGFWNIKDRSPHPKKIIPAAPILARYLDPLAYANVDFRGRSWAVMTDANGDLASRADIIISASNLKNFESGLRSEWIANKRCLTGEEFEELLTSSPSISGVRLLKADSKADVKKLGLLLVLTFFVFISFKYVANYKKSLSEQESQAQSALARERAKRLKESISLPSPSEWMKACLITASSRPYFNAGWVITKWSCSKTSVELTWSRTFGTVSNKPPGTLNMRGDEVKQKIALHVKFRESRRVKSEQGLIKLYALLQPLGIKVDVVKSPSSLKIGEKGAGYAFKLEWAAGSPVSIDWDSIPGLYFTEVRFKTGLEQPDVASSLRPENYTIFGILDKVGSDL